MAGLKGDLLGRALAAAATAMGRCVERAKAARSGQARAPVVAVAVAIERAACLTRVDAARIVGVNAKVMSRAVERRTQSFAAGVAAAEAVLAAGGVTPTPRGQIPPVAALSLARPQGLGAAGRRITPQRKYPRRVDPNALHLAALARGLAEMGQVGGGR